MNKLIDLASASNQDVINTSTHSFIEFISILKIHPQSKNVPYQVYQKTQFFPNT